MSKKALSLNATCSHSIKVLTRNLWNDGYRTEVIAPVDGRPLWESLYQRCYQDEDEARIGHAEIVSRLRALKKLWPHQVAEALA